MDNSDDSTPKATPKTAPKTTKKGKGKKKDETPDDSAEYENTTPQSNTTPKRAKKGKGKKDGETQGDSADYDVGNSGGFINPRHHTERKHKIKWTAENDRKLLLFALGKEISPKEYAAIAKMFPENPTPKAIQERLAKLRKEQMQQLAEMKDKIEGPVTKIHPLNPEDEGDDSDDQDKPSGGATASPAPWSFITRPATEPSTFAATTPAEETQQGVNEDEEVQRAAQGLLQLSEEVNALFQPSKKRKRTASGPANTMMRPPAKLAHPEVEPLPVEMFRRGKTTKLRGKEYARGYQTYEEPEEEEEGEIVGVTGVTGEEVTGEGVNGEGQTGEKGGDGDGVGETEEKTGSEDGAGGEEMEE